VTAYQFTFSNEVKPRLFRHLAFWFSYFAYTVILNIPGLSMKILTDPDLYKSALLEAVYYLPVYVFSFYFSLYYILPKYLNKRNPVFLILSLLFLLLITFTGTYFITSHFVFHGINADTQDILTVFMIKGNGEQLIITGTAVSIKIIKDHFLREEEFQRLTVQRIYQQLDMMKMKMEPAIILGVLKNIQADIEQGGKKAPAMILRLSDLLSYILYESNEKRVLLKKEINMLIDYTRLKELIFGDRLSTAIQISGEADHQMVVPLVLLPFLEFCFPGETGDIRESFRTELNIRLENNSFQFTCQSSLPYPGINHPAEKTILENALKNLQLQYPERHTIRLRKSPEGFEVFMELKLDSRSDDNKISI
jgi:hypothetical protein